MEMEIGINWWWILQIISQWALKKINDKRHTCRQMTLNHCHFPMKTILIKQKNETCGNIQNLPNYKLDTMVNCSRTELVSRCNRIWKWRTSISYRTHYSCSKIGFRQSYSWKSKQKSPKNLHINYIHYGWSCRITEYAMFEAATDYTR